MQNSCTVENNEVIYTNGWLALYAENIAKRLEGKAPDAKYMTPGAKK